MYSQTNQLLDGMLKSVRQATETNLNLQKEVMLGWTRLLPGFTNRDVKPTDTIGRVGQHWSEALTTLAKTHRDLLEQQVKFAVSSMDMAMGPIKGQAEPAEQTKAEPKKEKKAEKTSGKLPAKPAAPIEIKRRAEPVQPVGDAKNIYQKVAVVTGGASGIGAAVSQELARRGARAVILVDRSEAVQEMASAINDSFARPVAVAQVGDTTDEGFRKRVYNEAAEKYGVVSICVPAAGITRDSLSIRMNKETGKAELYPLETFRQVTEVNLLAPISWGIEMVARIAEDRAQRSMKRWDPEETTTGAIVFLGSVSSQGNKGQISYAVAKAGLEGAAATLQKEAIFHGVRCGVIHPGFTDTPMVRALGEDYLNKYVLPYTQLRRLIHPEEIADAICFMISNSAVSGELWADAGWHPPA